MPVRAILCGAKVSDKIQLTETLLGEVDKISSAAAGVHLPECERRHVHRHFLHDERGAKIMPEIMEEAMALGVGIIPVEVTLSSKAGQGGEIRTSTKENGIPDGSMGLDSGEKSMALNEKAVNEIRTIIWDGPMGVFAMSKFEIGTKSLGTAIGVPAAMPRPYRISQGAVAIEEAVFVLSCPRTRTLVHVILVSLDAAPPQVVPNADFGVASTQGHRQSARHPGHRHQGDSRRFCGGPHAHRESWPSRRPSSSFRVPGRAPRYT